MQRFARMSVLIVESDTAQNRSVAELTSELGVLDIVRVYTSEAALSWLSSRGFDIMICAEQLGTEDGVQLAREALRVSPATRVLLVRAEGSTSAPPLGDLESLGLPLSIEKLGDVLQRARDPRGGLWCEVPELSLGDILQMYHLGRRSISVLLSGPVAGRIHLHAGEIADAECGALRGLQALSRLLEASSGLLRTDTTQAELARTITLPFEHAILEATRQLDERRRDSRPSEVSLPEAENVSTVQPSDVPIPALPAAAQEAAPFAFAKPNDKSKAPVVIAATLVAALVLLGTVGIYFANRSLAPGPTQVVSSLNPQPAQPHGTADTSGPTSAAAGTKVTAAGRIDAGGPHESSTLGEPGPVADAEDGETVPSTFELSIVSKPPRAIVKEGNKVLGRTPLKLTIERESVAKAPRQFLLLMKGYRPYTFSQHDSKTDARAVAMLAPRRRPPPRATELKRPGEAASGPQSKPGSDSNPPLRH